MPTGYTSIVAENENLTFPEFVMYCARNFSPVLYTYMRDEPLDAPTPKEFKPSDHYHKWYIEAKEAYENFLANPPTDEDLEKQYDKYVVKENERFAKEKAERDIKYRRYKEMLTQVRKWQPPTPEHEPLREFIIKQLQDSIKSDCKEYTPHILSKQEYISERQSGEHLKRELDYHAKQWEDEVARVKACNQWLKGLRESLKEFEL